MIQGSGQPAFGGSPAYEGIAIRQKIALTVNRYEIRTLDPAGREGALLAYAEQKRIAFRERVDFLDERRTKVFSFKTRQVLDIAPTVDVFDAAGVPIGWFKKEFGKSFLKTTWSGQDAAGISFSGSERSLLVALLRRFTDNFLLDNFYGFDFHTDDGRPVMHHSRAGTLRDCYSVDLPALRDGRRLDWRMAAALGVALDALQER